MNLTKKEISDSTAMELCARVTRLQFDEEASCATADDRKEMRQIEKELRKRLITMLGRDFYPPERPTIKKLLKRDLASERKPPHAEARALPQVEAERPRLEQIKLKSESDTKIKLKITVFSGIGSKVAEFNAEVDSKAEADMLARKEIRKLGLAGATYKIS